MLIISEQRVRSCHDAYRAGRERSVSARKGCRLVGSGYPARASLTGPRSPGCTVPNLRGADRLVPVALLERAWMITALDAIASRIHHSERSGRAAGRGGGPERIHRRLRVQHRKPAPLAPRVPLMQHGGVGLRQAYRSWFRCAALGSLVRSRATPDDRPAPVWADSLKGLCSARSDWVAAVVPTALFLNRERAASAGEGTEPEKGRARHDRSGRGRGLQRPSQRISVARAVSGLPPKIGRSTTNALDSLKLAASHGIPEHRSDTVLQPDRVQLSRKTVPTLLGMSSRKSAPVRIAISRTCGNKPASKTCLEAQSASHTPVVRMWNRQQILLRYATVMPPVQREEGTLGSKNGTPRRFQGSR